MRVLLCIDQPLVSVRGRIAGLQVRASEMARALDAAGHEVTLAQTAADAPGGFGTIRVIPLEQLDREPVFDAVVVAPIVWARHRRRIRSSRLIVDGYEAPFASFRSHAAALRPRRPRVVDAWYRGTVIDYLQALSVADAVVCANPRQQLSYETLLCAIGADGPGRLREEDVLMVHSGVPPDPVPALVDPAFLAISARGPVVLWAGGAYPWFDLETFLRAIPSIAARVPTAQVLFAGLQGVGRDGSRWQPDHVRAFDGLNAVSDRLHFVDWLPYGDRAQLYRCARVAVSAHHPGLETTLSMRTRLVDQVWAGTPIAATSGDWLTDTLGEQNAAVVVPPAASSRLADAVVGLLTDSGECDRVRAALESVARGWLRWDVQIAPLDEYLRRAAVPGPQKEQRDHGSVRIRSRRWNQMSALNARFKSWAARRAGAPT